MGSLWSVLQWWILIFSLATIFSFISCPFHLLIVYLLVFCIDVVLLCEAHKRMMQLCVCFCALHFIFVIINMNSIVSKRQNFCFFFTEESGCERRTHFIINQISNRRKRTKPVQGYSPFEISRRSWSEDGKEDLKLYQTGLTVVPFW